MLLAIYFISNILLSNVLDVLPFWPEMDFCAATRLSIVMMSISFIYRMISHMASTAQVIGYKNHILPGVPTPAELLMRWMGTLTDSFLQVLYVPWFTATIYYSHLNPQRGSTEISTEIRSSSVCVCVCVILWQRFTSVVHLFVSSIKEPHHVGLREREITSMQVCKSKREKITSLWLKANLFGNDNPQLPFLFWVIMCVSERLCPCTSVCLWYGCACVMMAIARWVGSRGSLRTHSAQLLMWSWLSLKCGYHPPLCTPSSTHTYTHSPEKLPDLSTPVKALIAVLTLCAGLRVYACVSVCFCEFVSHISV